MNEREFMVWVRKGRKRQRENVMGCRGNETDMYILGLYLDGWQSSIKTDVKLYPGNLVTLISDLNTCNYLNITLLNESGEPVTLENMNASGWAITDNRNSNSPVCASFWDDGDMSDTGAPGDKGYNLMGGRVKITNNVISCGNDYAYYSGNGAYTNALRLELVSEAKGMRVPFNNSGVTAYDSQFNFDFQTLMSAVNDATSSNIGGQGSTAANNVYIVADSDEPLFLTGHTTKGPDGGKKEYYNFVHLGDWNDPGYDINTPIGAADINPYIRLIPAARKVAGDRGNAISAITSSNLTYELSGPVTLARLEIDIKDFYYETHSIWQLDNIRVSGLVTLEKDCYIQVEPEKTWQQGEIINLYANMSVSEAGDKVVDFSELTGVTGDDMLSRFELASPGYHLEVAGTTLVIAKTSYLLSYHLNNGDASIIETVYYGDLAVEPANDPIRGEYIFTGWYKDDDATQKWLFVSNTVTGDTEIYAGWSLVHTDSENVPAGSGGDIGKGSSGAATTLKPDKDQNPGDDISDLLITDIHSAYVVGRPGNLFAPQANMTRAEAAQMFYNLLRDKNKIITKTFPDIPAGAWYAVSVNTLASLGVVVGRSDGLFYPGDFITRAEFARLFVKWTNVSPGQVYFNDVPPNHWAYGYINAAARYGWIVGAGSGRFEPNRNITRAEAVTLMNNVLKRYPDKAYIDSHPETNRFIDIRKGYWAYYAIIEASYAHDYYKSGDKEIWLYEKTPLR